jgi:hypothetical protein
MYTICTQYVHNMYTVCTQYVQGMYTVFILCIHYFCNILMKRLSWIDFQKFPNMKFIENPYCGRWGFPCRRIDMTILIFAFRSVANAPMNCKTRDLIILVYNIICDFCLFHAVFFTKPVIICV